MSSCTQPFFSKSDSPFGIAAALSYEIKALSKSKIPGCIYFATGMGVENTSRHLYSTLSRNKYRALLFVGLAGALSPKLEIGDIVVVHRLINSEMFNPSPELISLVDKIKMEKNPIKRGSVVTVPTVISSAKERQDLADILPLNQNEIMDMESSAVNEVCSQLNIPFIIVRAVSDLHGEGFPIDFNQCLNTKGNIDLLKIIFSLAKKPQAIPELLRLGRRSKMCMDRLSLFLGQFIKAISY